MSPRPVAWLLAAHALLAGACARGGDAPPLRVFASASLTAAFEEAGAAWALARGAPPPELHFAGTPQLMLQLREGARADVLATADARHMDAAEAQGLLAGPPQVFAQNVLEVAVAQGNPRAIRGLADLARGDLVVALCGAEVPAGRYARTALEDAGVELRSRSDEPSVKALVAKVALGELDAGVVYRTDVLAAAGRVDGVPVPGGPVARYPAAPLRAARDPRAAADFVSFLRSPEGAALLRRHGFTTP